MTQRLRTSQHATLCRTEPLGNLGKAFVGAMKFVDPVGYFRHRPPAIHNHDVAMRSGQIFQHVIKLVDQSNNNVAPQVPLRLSGKRKIALVQRLS